MKSFLTILILSMCVCLPSCCSAQSDSQNISSAGNALDVKHNCQEALAFLNLVSDEGKRTPDYLLNMAKAQDCKMNYNQASYYYGKYLEVNPANDSVKKRVAELADNNAQRAVVAEEEHNAKKSYREVSKRKGHKLSHRTNLSDNYNSLGLGYGIAPSNLAPYKNSISLNPNMGFLIIDNHAVLDVNGNLNWLLSPNNNWFSKAVSVPSGSASLVGLGEEYSLNISICPILFNKRRSTLTLGVTAGYDLMIFPEVTDGTSYYSISNDWSFCYGIKSCYYLGENCFFTVKYSLRAAKTVNAQLANGSQNVAANFNVLSLGISYKLDSWW